MLIEREQTTHWVFKPFVAFWNYFSFLHDTSGGFIAAILGMSHLVCGSFLAATPVGIPLIIFGLFLLTRSVFK
ncbi:MAG: hypothetical protein ACE5I1_08175 [bacterium]